MPIHKDASNAHHYAHLGDVDDKQVHPLPLRRRPAEHHAAVADTLGRQVKRRARRRLAARRRVAEREVRVAVAVGGRGRLCLGPGGGRARSWGAVSMGQW
jgi:hypothetical protein